MDQPVSPVKGIRERDAVNGYIVVADHNFSRARYEYLVTRRDQMQDRLRFGAMALNGASLAGLMAAMGGDGKAASWAGLSGAVALWSATAFILGITCAGIAALIASNKYTTESGDAFKRYMTAKRLAATYEGGDWDQAGAAMNEHHESPLVDFQYSAASVAFQNVAHGCWLAGICLPVVTKLLA